jgi:Methylene-tetrahydrofolate reductase C terminal
VPSLREPPADPASPAPGDGPPRPATASPRPAVPTPATASPRPAAPRLGAGLLYRVQRLLAPNPFYRRLARWLEAARPARRIFTAGERAAKSRLFGCQMCGQCTLPVTGYACPMSCPKQLRNGPCGGVGADGSCEVYPELRCVWVVAWERAASQGHVADLRLLQRPVDQRERGRSSWLNYWQGRDEGMWIDAGELLPVPAPARPAAPALLRSR